LNTPLSDGGKERLSNGTEELELAHVADMHAHQVLNLATVRLLQGRKAANIEWLEEVGGMRRHAECDYVVVLLAIELEFGRVVAFVAVKDQQPVFAFCTRCCMEVEVLDPIQAYCIGSPAIISGYNAPVGLEVALGVPVGEVVLRSQDDEQRDGPAEGIDSLDYRCPFAVTRLGQLCLATAIRGRNHHAREDDAHHKPSLIEVVDIIIHNPVLGHDVQDDGKPLSNNLWILALGPLIVVPTYPTRTELWLAFDEVICLAFADRGRVAFMP